MAHSSSVFRGARVRMEGNNTWFEKDLREDGGEGGERAAKQILNQKGRSAKQGTEVQVYTRYRAKEGEGRGEGVRENGWGEEALYHSAKREKERRRRIQSHRLQPSVPLIDLFHMERRSPESPVLAPSPPRNGKGWGHCTW